MRGLARFCVRRRGWVVAAWLVVLIAMVALSQSIGSAYHDSFSLSGTDSYAALTLLQKSAPASSGDIERIVISAPGAGITDPAVQAQVSRMLDEVAKVPGVTSVASPYGPRGAEQISPSGRIAFATVTFAESALKIPKSVAHELVTTAKAGGGNGVQVEVEGSLAEEVSTTSVNSTAYGAIAALIVMLLVFGSVMAATLPLITAGVALGIAVAVIALMSHGLTVASFSSQLSLLIGLGVGVDYSLFIVTRHRQGVLRGKSIEESIVDAIDTSGRAVMFAGITVCIALLGLFTLGVSFLYGVAIAASIAVAFTAAAALTLLPALLGFFGTLVLGRKARRRLKGGTRTTTDASGGWGRWAKTVERHPVVIGTVGLLIMFALAIPFLSMRLGSSDAGSDPSGTTTRKAYDLLAEGFGPGYNGPLELVAAISNPAQEADFAKIVAAVGATPGVVHVTPPTLLPNPHGGPDVAIANAYPKGSPQDASTSNLLTHLRHTVIPDATPPGGPKVLVGGTTAIFADFAAVLGAKLPLFIGIVVVFSFILLAAVFRSLLVPLIAAGMNLLTAASSFGVITAVFQWGWFDAAFGIKTGPIEAFVPVMMFAIVFGLSMDYEVFLVSRIYEEWHRTKDPKEAVSRGLAATGRTITAAAAIMVLVFGAFILGGTRVIELFGFGLAIAVLLDAVIGRSAIVPALMIIGGRATWWLPKSVDRFLPSLNVEGSATEHPVDADPVADSAT